MGPSLRDAMFKLLIKHEGLKLKAYLCPQEKLTIGVGRNIEDLGISKSEALILLVNDIERVQAEAKEHIVCYELLDDVRKSVVLSMLFNLGLPRFLKFKNFISHLNNGDFTSAAEELKTSLWYQQVGVRGEDLYEMMLSGQYISSII